MDRKYLDELIALNDGESWWKPDSFLSEISPKLPKELEIVSPPPDELNYNCFIFMLGLNEEKDILSDSSGFIYDGFILKLIENNILEEIDKHKVSDSDFVIYSNLKEYPGTLTHGGIFSKGKIISKWAWGPIFIHEILDVPESYGSELKFFKAIHDDITRSLYWDNKVWNKPINPNK